MQDLTLGAIAACGETTDLLYDEELNNNNKRKQIY